MLTDEQLIQQIRTELYEELAALEPPADLLKRLAARAGEPRPPARVPARALRRNGHRDRRRLRDRGGRRRAGLARASTAIACRDRP